MTKMEIQNRLVMNLLTEQTPIIAWDWDGTLSMNGVHARERLLYIQEKLTEIYGFHHIIVTGREYEFAPLRMDNSLIPIRVFYNTEGGSPFRFKLWILHKLYNKGNGILRMYVDNDSELVVTLTRSNIPACRIASTDLSWFEQNLQIFRTIEGKERIRKRE